MNVKRKIVCVLLAASTVLSAAACSTTNVGAEEGSLAKLKESGKLSIGVRDDSPPFGSLNPGTNNLEGFDIDVSKELAKRIIGSADAANLVKVSSSTRIPLLQQGEIDVSVATITITEDRKKQVSFSDPYFPSGMAVLVPADSGIKSPSGIGGKINCIVTGAVAGDLVEKAAKEKYGIEDIQSIALGSYPECALALQQGRADFIGTDEGTLLGLAKQYQDFKVLPEMMSNEPWGIAVAKDNTELQTAINDALKAMFDDGTWNELYKKWIRSELPADWPPAG